jgi:hypothetical protein
MVMGESIPSAEQAVNNFPTIAEMQNYDAVPQVSSIGEASPSDLSARNRLGIILIDGIESDSTVIPEDPKFPRTPLAVPEFLVTILRFQLDPIPYKINARRK